MTTSHVPFETLSDLIDDELSAREKELVLLHVNECADCRAELLRLRGTVELCGDLAAIRADFSGLSRRVVGRARFRRTVRSFVRFAPAAAAAVVLISSYAIFYDGSEQQEADTAVTREQERIENVAIETPRPVDDVEEVIGILRDNNATITNVSDLYVEGKISVEQFERLRRHLGFRQVAFSVTNEAPAQGVNIMPSYMEEVGSDGGFGQTAPIYRATTGERYVRFRVFR
ncbi:MAG: zf-HC2 domain-containing protein [Spirochaetes bacterium]|nr:zf-HC2 domain-containing protein [Spirochaetota bacterium]